MTAVSKENQLLLTAEEARRLFSYDPDTGVLIRKVRTSCRSKVGEVAGTIPKNARKKYCKVGINGVIYLAHRVIWLIVTGDWPDNEIDHDNGNGIDNRWNNLNCATVSQNCKNRKQFSTNTSGATGVFWRANRKRWVAYIWIHGKYKTLGHFRKKEYAIAARKAAETEMGYHPLHGTKRNH